MQKTKWLFVMLFALSPLLIAGGSHSNGVITANGGTTFDLVPTADPSIFTHTVDGLAQVSSVGNCIFHADVIAHLPAAANEPWKLEGTGQFVSADGQSVLRVSVQGWVVSDPANPAFGNLHYDAEIKPGEGKFAGAHGRGEIDGAGLFTSATTGKATWLFRGNIVGR